MSKILKNMTIVVATAIVAIAGFGLASNQGLKLQVAEAWGTQPVIDEAWGT